MRENFNNNEFEVGWLKSLKLFGAYIISVIGIITSLDSIQDKMDLPYNLVTLAVYFFITLTPFLLLLYLYRQKKIHKRITKKLERENGASIVTKDQFNPYIPISSFESINTSTDGEYRWLRDGISVLLVENLLQSKILHPVALPSSFGMTDKISISLKLNSIQFFDKATNLNSSYFVDGKFEFNKPLYSITVFIKKIEFAEIIMQKAFTGTDILTLLDDIAHFINKILTPAGMEGARYLDIPLKEFLSNSLKALEYYVVGDYEKAIEHDKTFALAYLKLAKNECIKEKKKYVEKAYQYRSKLLGSNQGEAVILKYIVHKEFSKAKELLQLLIEEKPDIGNELYIHYSRTKNIDEFVTSVMKITQNNPKLIFNRSYAFFLCGNYKMGKTLLFKENWENHLYPVSVLRMYCELISGNTELVEKMLYNIQLKDADWCSKHSPVIQRIERAIQHQKKRKITLETVRKFKGTYLGGHNEQTDEYLTKNNALVCYSIERGLVLLTMIDEDTFLEIPSSSFETYYHSNWKRHREREVKFIKSRLGSFFAVKKKVILNYSCEYSQKEQCLNWNDVKWKTNDTIQTAKRLLEEGNLNKAKQVYKKAIAVYPNHIFLKDALAYIKYIQNTHVLDLLEQYRRIEGFYGQEEEDMVKIWVKEKKLIIREGENNPFQLRPIAKNGYISLELPGMLFIFEFKEEKSINFITYDYDPEVEEWRQVQSKANILMKNL